MPEASSPLALALLAFGLLLYAFLGVRAINTFLLTRRNADMLVVIGLSFLGTALVGALVLSYMQLGWWLGHGFELLGILLVGIPVAIDLHRAQPSRSLTGGPRAGELFLSGEDENPHLRSCRQSVLEAARRGFPGGTRPARWRRYAPPRSSTRRPPTSTTSS